MIRAFKNDSLDMFKERYRNECDVLILEDMHFLTGKDRTQIELALGLDYLLNAPGKKFIILPKAWFILSPGRIINLKLDWRPNLAAFQRGFLGLAGIGFPKGNWRNTRDFPGTGTKIFKGSRAG